MTVGAWNDAQSSSSPLWLHAAWTTAKHQRQVSACWRCRPTLASDRARTCRPASRACSRFAGRLEASTVLSKSTTRDHAPEGLARSEKHLKSVRNIISKLCKIVFFNHINFNKQRNRLLSLKYKSEIVGRRIYSCRYALC